MLSTFLSVALAISLALLLGSLLGRTAVAGFRGRAAVNLLIEARGALLPFVLLAMLLSLPRLAEFVTVGLVAGLLQGVAMARWISRHENDWSTLLGDIALGHSDVNLALRAARARGAVTSTVAFTVVLVVTLEALILHIPGRTPSDPGTLGARLASSDSALGGWLVLAALLWGLDATTRRLLAGSSASFWPLRQRRKRV